LLSGDLRRFTISSLSDLKKELSISNERKEILKYQDEEKDFILLTCDTDWIEAVSFGFSVLKVKIFLSNSNPSIKEEIKKKKKMKN